MNFRSSPISPRATWAEKVGRVAMPIPEPMITSGTVMIGKAKFMAESEPVGNRLAMIPVTTKFNLQSGHTDQTRSHQNHHLPHRRIALSQGEGIVPVRQAEQIGKLDAEMQTGAQYDPPGETEDPHGGDEEQ